MKRICVYEPAPQSAVAYYRSLGVLSELTRMDPEISVSSPSHISWSTLINYDIFYVGRPWQEQDFQAIEMAKNFGLKVWIDYDDLFPAIPKWNPSYKALSSQQAKKISEESIKLADIVTVSTIEIQEYYKSLNPNITIIENALNDYRYPLQHFKLPESKDILVAWRGSATHKHDLWSVKEAIWNVDKEKKDIQWLFVGNEHWFVTDFLQKKCFSVSECDIIDYHKLITSANISVMIVPLVDIQFNRAKSDISYLEATLAGAPCLGPDLPEFNRPGCIQYRSAESTHFEYLLEKLISSRKMRQENYDQAYEYVVNNRLLSTVNKKRVEVVNSLSR